MENVGGIWKKTINTKNGPVEIFSISLGGKRYTAWPNSYKMEGDKSPDYKIQQDQYKPKTVQANVQATVQDNDLPF